MSEREPSNPENGQAPPGQPSLAGRRSILPAVIGQSGRKLLTHPRTASRAESSRQELASVALFSADDGTRGRELWITNGTFPGTRRVADLLPGPRGSAPHDLVRFGNRVYFLTTNGGLGESLWRTDGTAAGTVRVRDLTLDGHPSWGRGLTVAGSRLYFTVYNETTGAELWASTGSTSAPAWSLI